MRDHAAARSDRLWTVAQVVAFAATLVLLVGMLRTPDTALGVLWNVLIPLVPASLLISPQLWRNVCPLATANMATNGLIGHRIPSEKAMRVAASGGMVLLLVLVPARRFVFNTNGPVLAVTVVAVVVAALVLGAVFDAKAGFCNAICPVLPVERLYGQRPLLRLGNPRCPRCTLCSVKGCIDLSPQKAVTARLGRKERSHGWLITPFGAFAAGFPGFVLGYFRAVDGPLSSAGAVYLEVFAWMAASYLATTLVVRLLRIGSPRALLTLAATAAGLYYWFAAPSMADFAGLPSGAAIALQGVFLTLVAVWYGRAVLGSRA
jgi:hypothetical protein